MRASQSRGARAVRSAVVAASVAGLAGIAGVGGVGGLEQPARGGTLYWDTDGATPGPGTFLNGGWSPVASSFNWNPSSAGDGPALPWQIDDNAVFTAGTFNGAFLVSVIAPVSASSIRFEDGTATLNGSLIILTGAGGVIDAPAPSTQINVGIIGNVGLTKNGGGTLTLGVSPSYSGDTHVNAGTLRLDTDRFINSSALNVAAGATFQLDTFFDTSGVIQTPSVSVTTTGRIDLTDNKLITDTSPGSAAGSVYDGVQGLVQRAFNDGAWDGGGIATSMPDALTGLTGIGVATGAQVRGLAGAQTDTFAGQTISATSTLAMYTYVGDANLDGFISGDDYSAIDFASATPGAQGWNNGDFNWDGFISGDDYSAIDFNLVAQGAPFPTGAAAAATTAVPEPAGVAAVALGLASASRRRRRSSAAAASVVADRTTGSGKGTRPATGHLGRLLIVGNEQSITRET